MSAATRRRALGSLAAAGANVAVSPVAAAEDPHPEWERELSRLRAGYARWLDDEATSVLYDQIVEVEAKIAHTPATTPSGLAAQIRAVIGASDQGSTLSDSDLIGLHNAVAVLERLTGKV